LNSERNDGLGQIYRLVGNTDAAFPPLFGEGKILSTKPLDTAGAYSCHDDHSFPSLSDFFAESNPSTG
jgi:hypothetical protein